MQEPLILKLIREGHEEREKNGKNKECREFHQRNVAIRQSRQNHLEKTPRGRPKKIQTDTGDSGERSVDWIKIREEMVNVERKYAKKHEIMRRKRKNIMFTEEEKEKVMIVYSMFQKSQPKSAVSRTVNHFKGKYPYSNYKFLKHQHVSYWIKTWGKVKNARGRKTVLCSETLEKVHQVIHGAVKAKRHRITSSSLREPIIEVICQSGEGNKIGDSKGKLNINQRWINRQCVSCGLAMRMVTKPSGSLPRDWRKKMRRFILQLAYLVIKYRLTEEDVYNMDQTAQQFNAHACGGKTRAKKGAKQVAVHGADDKRQVTVVPIISANGDKLPLQIIFKGTEGWTRTGKRQMRSIPDYKTGFRNLNEKWRGTIYAQTKNGWANEDTNIDLIEKVLIPHVRQNKEKRIASGKKDVPAKFILILDCWPSQRTNSFIQRARSLSKDLILLYLPPKLTGELQPLDVAVNATFKAMVKAEYGRQQMSWIKKKYGSVHHLTSKDEIRNTFDDKGEYDIFGLSHMDQTDEMDDVSQWDVETDTEDAVVSAKACPSRNQTLMDKMCILECIQKGWQEVQPSTVVKAWRKAGRADYDKEKHFGLLMAWDERVQMKAMEVNDRRILFRKKDKGGMVSHDQMLTSLKGHDSALGVCHSSYQLEKEEEWDTLEEDTENEYESDFESEASEMGSDSEDASLGSWFGTMNLEDDQGTSSVPGPLRRTRSRVHGVRRTYKMK